MTTAIFAGGHEATARAQIKAAVLARWASGPDGAKVLDTDSLLTWLNDQFASMHDEEGAPNEQAYTTVPTRYLVSSLNDGIKRERWVDHPDFPGSDDVLSGLALLTAARDGQAELKRMSDDITAHYQALRSQAEPSVIDYATRIRADGRMPPAVERQVESRLYRYTFVTDWGEESAPSDPSPVIDIDQNDGVAVTVDGPPPGRFVTKWRLYRSAMGAASAAWQLVKEFDIADLADVVDDVKPELLGEVLVTEGWFEPPQNLRGLTALPNGIMAGFFDNTVCFCDPYHPYAWPIEYQVTVDQPIVGMAAFDQGLFVATRGGAFVVGGADSASMSATKISTDQVCVNPRTIVPMGAGVAFSSPDGLCFLDGSGVRLLTEGHFTRSHWRSLGLQDPDAFASSHDGVCYLFLGDRAYFYDLGAQKVGSVDVIASAAWSNPVTDTLYVCVGEEIRAMHAGPELLTGWWRSKIAVFESTAPLAWLMVESDFAFGPVTVRWWGDGVLQHTAVVTSRQPVRLPSGRWLEHQVDIESKSAVTAVVLAGSTRELQAV